MMLAASAAVTRADHHDYFVVIASTAPLIALAAVVWMGDHIRNSPRWFTWTILITFAVVEADALAGVWQGWHDVRDALIIGFLVAMLYVELATWIAGRIGPRQPTHPDG